MNLIETLSEIKDNRSDKGKRHSLPVVLLIVVMGTMSGYYGNRALGSFATNRKVEECEVLRIDTKRVTSNETISTILASVGYETLGEAFNKWARGYVTLEAQEAVAIDGKTLGSTVSNSTNSEQDFVSMISAFSHRHGVVLGSMSMQNKKSSEITKVRELIEILGLKDVVFTMDALHSQKKRQRQS